jgi:hypothetical protein
MQGPCLANARSHLKWFYISAFGSISSQWKAFKDFCREANVLTLSINESEVHFPAIWVTYTGRSLTKGSLAQYFSVVRTVHKMLRLPPVPTPSEYGSLDMIIKDFRRMVQHLIKNPLSAAPPILENLPFSHIPPHYGTTHHHTLGTTATSRQKVQSSKLIVKLLTDVDLRMVFTWKDVTHLHNSMENGSLISTPKSKNIRFGKRPHEFPLTATADSPLCPVEAIKSLAGTFVHMGELVGQLLLRSLVNTFVHAGELVGQLLHHVGLKPLEPWTTMEWLGLTSVYSLLGILLLCWSERPGLNPSLHGTRQAGMQERFPAEGNPAPRKSFT